MFRNLVLLSLCGYFFIAGGCAASCPTGHSQATGCSDVSEAMARTAVYVFDRRFDVDSVADQFSEKELAILEQHPRAVVSMIEGALDTQQSVGGALLASHFGMHSLLPLLRFHLLQPSDPYGWEGPDYTEPENNLQDNQYVYAVHYLAAIEQITSKPIHEAIVLSVDERDRILQHVQAHTVDGSPRWWHIWIARKLKLNGE